MGNYTHNVIFMLEEPALNYWAVCAIKCEGKGLIFSGFKNQQNSQWDMKIITLWLCNCIMMSCEEHKCFLKGVLKSWKKTHQTPLTKRDLIVHSLKNELSLKDFIFIFYFE